MVATASADSSPLHNLDCKMRRMCDASTSAGIREAAADAGAGAGAGARDGTGCDAAAEECTGMWTGALAVT
jgi:hypothetical protein